jgi:hypothetical protein
MLACALRNCLPDDAIAQGREVDGAAAPETRTGRDPVARGARFRYRPQ